MRVLFFVFNFFLQLINKNRIKITLISSCIIGLFIAFNYFYDDLKTEYNIQYEIKANNGSYIYLGTKTGQSEFDVYQTDKKMTHHYIKEDTHPAFAVINVFAWITLVVTIVMSFGTDKDLNWEFDEVWELSFSSLISCEIEDGKYYYLALGRLLYTSDQLIRHPNISSYLNVTNFSQLSNYPKFETKRDKREKALAEILK